MRKIPILLLILVISSISQCHALLGVVCHWRGDPSSGGAGERQNTRCCFRDNSVNPGCCDIGGHNFMKESGCSVAGYNVKHKIEEIDVAHIKRRWTVWKDGLGQDSGSVSIEAFANNANNPSGYCAYKDKGKKECQDTLNLACQQLHIDQSWCNKANIWADANY